MLVTSETMAPVRILLVDDLPENLLSLEALLRREDVHLLKARSGDAALELLLTQDVALALLDVQMPGMDGFELAEFMRGTERTRHVPIIFVTAGTADSQRRFRGYEAGAVDFIQKPIEADVLRSKVSVFLDLYRQRRQIAAQRDELAAASEALREADRRKDEFLAILAHELRNPVAALDAGLRLLKKHGPGETADMIRERMGHQVFHLARLVEDLLDVSRITAGKISLRKEAIPLADVFGSAVDASHPNIEAAGHTLTVELPDDPPVLHADHTRLAQVISNLLNNSAKYTPAGGQITLRGEVHGPDLEIGVIDNGLGIPPEMQARIFDIFTQVPAHKRQYAGGLGIGLALVQQLVALHGGAISVYSAGEGLGSRFTVRMPIAG